MSFLVLIKKKKKTFQMLHAIYQNFGALSNKYRKFSFSKAPCQENILKKSKKFLFMLIFYFIDYSLCLCL